MGYIYHNSNPKNKRIGDCVIRAVAKVTNQTWEDTYIALATKGLKLCDLPSANSVWGAYLKDIGFKQYAMPNTCPDCYTVMDFCIDFPIGVYLVATDGHVVAVINGDYYDTWDSGNEVPLYYWTT